MEGLKGQNTCRNWTSPCEWWS